jgi:hypothetical protein
MFIDMIQNDININAGIIWNLLNEKGMLSIREINKHTNFRESLIYYSLGWLARENKICFFEIDESMYVELANNFKETYY